MTSRLTPEREAEIAARAEAATPGPWGANTPGGFVAHAREDIRCEPEREHSDYRRWSDYQHAVDCPAAEIQMRTLGAWIDERIRRRPNQRHIWRVVKRLLADEETETSEATNNRESIVNKGES